MHLRMKFAVVLAVSLAATASLYGQNRASITGTVRDVTGAVLPSATVAVTDVATGVTLKATTNAQGDYLVAGLLQATYNLKVTAHRFQDLRSHRHYSAGRPEGPRGCHPASRQIATEVSVAGTERGPGGDAVV